VSSAARRFRILVVEDDTVVRRTITRLLRAHDVVEAGHGGDALRILGEDGAFDVILCDIEMPTMRGDELYAQVARLNPALAEKMIFMTGASLSGQSGAFLKTEGRPVLFKPFQPSQLDAAVNEIGAAHAKRDEPR
jgi:CheY-like chemotaxis protein